MDENDDYLKLIEEKTMPEFSDIPQSSKKALSTAALFTEVWSSYIKKNVCHHVKGTEDEKQWVTEILDHVIIVGGFCRDLLLNAPINDIDIMINLRELCKLQTNHLKKYHGTPKQQDLDEKNNNQCIYWKRYQNKLKNPQQMEEQKLNQDIVAFHQYDFLFNGIFWLRILNSDELCHNKISWKNVEKHGYYDASVVGQIMYGGINLDGQKIDVIDTFNIDQHSEEALYGNDDKFKEFHRKQRQKSMSGIAINQADIEMGDTPPDTDDDIDDEYIENRTGRRGSIRDDSKRRGSIDAKTNDQDVDDIDPVYSSNSNGDGPKRLRKVRLASRAALEFDLAGAVDDDDTSSWGFNKKSNFAVIELPIYSGKVRYKLLNYDFSINTAILPFSNIEQLKENTLRHLKRNENDDDDIDPRRATWVDMIENGLGECDASADCYNRILRVPESGHEHCTVDAHPKTFIFWRIIRWQIRNKDKKFTIDGNLMKAVLNDSKSWLNIEWFSEKKNCKRFMAMLKGTIERECTQTDDIKAMLGTMKELEFTEKFKDIMDKDQTDIRYSLKDTIYEAASGVNSLNGQDVVGVLKENGYSIEEQYFKIPSEKDKQFEEWDKERNILIMEKNNYREQVNAKTKTITSLQKQLDTLRRENDVQEKELKSAQTRSRSAKDQKVSEASKRAEAAKQDLEKVTREMNQLKQEKEQLEKQLNEERKTWEKKTKKWEKERNDLENQKVKMLKETTKTIDQLRDFLRQYQRALADAGIKI